MNGTGDDSVLGEYIRNTNRESSVYIRTDANLKRAHEYDESIPTDTSRFIATRETVRSDLSRERFFEIAKTNSVESLTAIVLGVQGAAGKIDQGSNNLGVVLMFIISSLLDKAVHQGTLEELDNYETLDKYCGQINAQG